MLFCVVTRGVERIRPWPDVSSAVSATSRLKAPLIDPSARPAALEAPGTARFTAVGTDALVLDPAAGPCWPPLRPESVPLLGQASGVVLPSAGSTRPLKIGRASCRERV